MTPITCAHGRQLSICAVCAPLADERYRCLLCGHEARTKDAAADHVRATGHGLIAVADVQVTGVRVPTATNR